ncbi:aminoglycoside phosphotransferase family protein [Legionella londiniensis]|uniref:Putative phosphotransferase n=1 Tax=Legionella londiniensis TaxID=45068 RepID=A0A0W0VII5_9GAMM|nr:phosphotransferase [Legionella londiniensis]KTD19940.1 putative phosphotransferase [Legionella londiniensis]STX94187.1 putative phosphotransferase [Legionella londiniensis]
MHTRQRALNKWLNDILNSTSFSLTPLAGDASFRQYFRLHHGECQYVVMDAPPDKEPISPFIHIADILAQAGIHTPHIFALDEVQGFVLMEDLGDLSFLKSLTSHNSDKLYRLALATLVKIQACPIPHDLLRFNQPSILKELALFSNWFLQQYLGLDLNSKEIRLIQKTVHWLAEEIQTQPQVFVHRDYHSRNIMVMSEPANPLLGVIDFQDAICGPITYDLVSLLKDCYIQLPKPQVSAFVEDFYQCISSQLKLKWTLAEFSRAFDLCGLQRHLKVLGIFSRLHIRDNKPAYLKDLPLTFHYVLDCLRRYPELRDFYFFMQNRVHEAFMETNA